MPDISKCRGYGRSPKRREIDAVMITVGNRERRHPGGLGRAHVVSGISHERGPVADDAEALTGRYQRQGIGFHAWQLVAAENEVKITCDIQSPQQGLCEPPGLIGDTGHAKPVGAQIRKGLRDAWIQAATVSDVGLVIRVIEGLRLFEERRVRLGEALAGQGPLDEPWNPVSNPPADGSLITHRAPKPRQHVIGGIGKIGGGINQGTVQIEQKPCQREDRHALAISSRIFWMVAR